MKHKFLLSILILSFFLIGSVNAQPPQSVQTNVNINVGLEIEFTKVNPLENGKDHLFNAHVFNISDQLRVSNITTDCSFHLFDNAGNHIINQQPMTYDIIGLDWEYNVLGGNFTRNGGYSFLIVCNATNVGGFVSVGIAITPTGNELDIPQGLIILGLILVLILLTAAFLYFGNEIEYLPFKIFLIAMGALFLMVTLGISVNIINELMIIGSVFSATFVNLFRLMLILVSGGAIGLMLYIVYMSIKQFYSYRGLVEDLD